MCQLKANDHYFWVNLFKGIDFEVYKAREEHESHLSVDTVYQLCKERSGLQLLYASRVLLTRTVKHKGSIDT